MTLNLPRAAPKHLKGLRVAVWADDPATHTDAEITAALHGARAPPRDARARR